MGVEGFMGLSVTVMVEVDEAEASLPSVDFGVGRCGWGGCGRRGSVYYGNAFSRRLVGVGENRSYGALRRILPRICYVVRG